MKSMKVVVNRLGNCSRLSRGAQNWSPREPKQDTVALSSLRACSGCSSHDQEYSPSVQTKARRETKTELAREKVAHEFGDING